MKRSTRIALLVILTLAVVVGGGATTWFLIDTQNYITTDNAQIDGDEISVNAPTSGYVVDWMAVQGARVQADHVVGRIRMEGGFVQPEMPVRAPGDATVVIDNARRGRLCHGGHPARGNLRLLPDLRHRTGGRDGHRRRSPRSARRRLGRRVPPRRPDGNRTRDPGGAAGVFSLLPESNTSGNFQKVKQVIPVEISLDNPGHLALVPGMNVTVKIHKGLAAVSSLPSKPT
jgi:hypothetical protein